MYITVKCRVCNFGWDVPINPSDGIEVKMTQCPACETWHKTIISIKHELAYVKGVENADTD